MTGQPSSRRALLLGTVVAAAAVTVVPVAGAEPYPPHRIAIRYDLSGAGVATYVTYQTNYGQQHATNVTLPWSVQISGYGASQEHAIPYSLSAQGPGSLTCRISVDGKVISESTAAGTPARVLCSPVSAPRTSTPSTP
ncbi:hypothetical protein KIH27_03805 [Mycobacterium sp. M1]|uniref:Uncharacterized protein n=1 Tax=Mycolicibacter acidiphilus TaxID=2835306 RepID=A0ABS5RET2_9MYCO|nr:MmpS family transport accessory protein [Mycolicibacter acidiphilus]MBS9532709.1 hypothetical protein [Mycolicibacter acidiphilus]